MPATIDTSHLSGPELDQAFFRDVMLDFANLARDFAHLLFQTAQRTTKPDDIIRLHAAFDRAGRCCRRSLLTHRHMQKPTPDADPERRRYARATIIRTVEDAIHAAPLEPGEKSGRHRELRDRLDTVELEADLTRRPITAIVDEIKRDLGLVFEELSKPIYKRRTPEDLARLNATAAERPKPPIPPPDRFDPNPFDPNPFEPDPNNSG